MEEPGLSNVTTETVAEADLPYSAFASMTGYLYQVEYALYRALDRDNPVDAVMVETLDDVVTNAKGQPDELLQLKHHTGNRAKLGDRAADLWKTIRVWSSQVSSSAVSADGTRFFLLTTAPPARGAKLALLLSPPDMAGKQQRDAATACELLTEIAHELAAAAEATGSGPKARDTIVACAESFLALRPADRSAMVRNITIVTGAPAVTDLRNRLVERLRMCAVPRKDLEAFARALLGWWYWSVVERLKDQSRKSISVNALEIQIEELASAYALTGLPTFAELLRPTEDDLAPLHERLFVQQLVAIGHVRGKASVTSAVVEFYKADGHILRWLRDLRLTPAELESFEADLTGHWSVAFGSAEAECGDLEDPGAAPLHQKLGRDTFQATLTGSSVTLKGFTGDYLRRGAFHRMANRPAIGWHPNWRALFPGGDGGDS